MCVFITQEKINKLIVIFWDGTRIFGANQKKLLLKIKKHLLTKQKSTTWVWLSGRSLRHWMSEEFLLVGLTCNRRLREHGDKLPPCPPHFDLLSASQEQVKPTNINSSFSGVSPAQYVQTQLVDFRFASEGFSFLFESKEFWFAATNSNLITHKKCIYLKTRNFLSKPFSKFVCVINTQIYLHVHVWNRRSVLHHRSKQQQTTTVGPASDSCSPWATSWPPLKGPASLKHMNI